MVTLESPRSSLFLVSFLAALFLGCGATTEPSGSTTPKIVPTASAVTSETTAPTEAPKGPTARDRLQGKWEIVRYQSDRGIPDEAMPVMSTLFSQLRLEFSGANAVARLEKTGAQEPTRFEIGYEKGDDFTLSAPGWIFHGARCRFTLDGQIEIKDAGEKWPGLSTLKRAP